MTTQSTLTETEIIISGKSSLAMQDKELFEAIAEELLFSDFQGTEIELALDKELYSDNPSREKVLSLTLSWMTEGNEV